MKTSFTIAQNPLRVFPQMQLISKKEYYLSMCEKYGSGWVLISSIPKAMIKGKHVFLFVLKDDRELIKYFKNENVPDCSHHSIGYMQIHNCMVDDEFLPKFETIEWSYYHDEIGYACKDLSLSLLQKFKNEYSFIG